MNPVRLFVVLVDRKSVRVLRNTGEFSALLDRYRRNPADDLVEVLSVGQNGRVLVPAMAGFKAEWMVNSPIPDPGPRSREDLKAVTRAVLETRAYQGGTDVELETQVISLLSDSTKALAAELGNLGTVVAPPLWGRRRSDATSADDAGLARSSAASASPVNLVNPAPRPPTPKGLLRGHDGSRLDRIAIALAATLALTGIVPLLIGHGIMRKTWLLKPSPMVYDERARGLPHWPWSIDIGERGSYFLPIYLSGVIVIGLALGLFLLRGHIFGGRRTMRTGRNPHPGPSPDSGRFEFDREFLMEILPPLELQNEALRRRYDLGRESVAQILGVDLTALDSDLHRRSDAQDRGRMVFGGWAFIVITLAVLVPLTVSTWNTAEQRTAVKSRETAHPGFRYDNGWTLWAENGAGQPELWQIQLDADRYKAPPDKVSVYRGWRYVGGVTLPDGDAFTGSIAVNYPGLQQESPLKRGRPDGHDRFYGPDLKPLNPIVTSVTLSTTRPRTGLNFTLDGAASGRFQLR